MALLFELLWRLLHVALRLLQPRALTRTGLLLWRRAAAAVLSPMVRGLPSPGAGGGSGAGPRGSRRALEKVPQHVGLLITDEEQHYTPLANVVVWCMALGVSYISVYDHQGVFRRNDSRLMEEIMKQKKEFLSSERSSKFSPEFLNEASRPALSYQPVVKVLSPGDGRLGIVSAARRLCEAVERRETAPDDIDVTTLDSVLRESRNLPDPELVLKFGSVDSTLGFLPWHIRLTEFVSLPSHGDVSYEDFLGAFRSYSACEQRLGK